MRASDALRLDAKNQLSTVAVSRSDALADYLASIEQDLNVVAESPTTLEALRAFSKAFPEVAANPEAALQKLYIEQSPYPVGEKHRLDAAEDGSAYSDAHRRYHPWFRTLLEARGYYDVFLFNLEGDLVYTVFKEYDFATNLAKGRWRNSDLGAAFRAAKAAKTGEVSFFDFASYEPSAGAPASFISMPVVDPQGVKLGVLAFQMPIDRLNAVMRVRAGMGETGEAYVVGADRLMRTDSRFAKESTILARTVSGPTVAAALDGRTGFDVVADYRGVDVVSAYAQVDFHGVRWAVLAEKDLAEVEEPVVELSNSLALITLISLAIISAVGYVAARMMTKPISRITASMSSLAEGDVDIDIDGLDRGDELGDMARAVGVFKQNAIERIRMQAEHEAAKKHAEAEKRKAMHDLADRFQLEVGDALSVLSGATTEMEATARNVRKIADDNASRAATVAAASEQASANVQMVAASAEEFGASLEEITRQVESSSAMTDDAVGEADAATSHVRTLAEAADQVGAIVNLIAEIASQTNLL
ncbi:MAG: methyl-accepting chemotaxis protein, partial [Alphaproteobacteria bacterium]